VRSRPLTPLDSLFLHSFALSPLRCPSLALLGLLWPLTGRNAILARRVLGLPWRGISAPDTLSPCHPVRAFFGALTSGAGSGYRPCRSGSNEWKSVQQRVPISLTACHLGGQRAWFVCSVYRNGRCCGRRAAILYGAGEFLPVGGAMACPMQANSRRRCIAAWGRRGRSG
jgi:hypothetical protein